MTDQEKLVEMFARVGKPLKEITTLEQLKTMRNAHSVYQFEDDLQQACVYYFFDVGGALVAVEIWE